MAFLSYSEIRNKASLLQERTYNFSKAASARGSVFLSHSSKDDDKVRGVFSFLKSFHVDVYVDDLDRRLPNPPSVETANILKAEIKNASRFVVLVSNNSKDSRWIPWELGLADGYKDVAPIAILPISPTGAEEEWAKTEYISLYPRIYEHSGEWRVRDPSDGKYWLLKNWLTSSN